VLFDGMPQIAFGGATPAEAVDRLVGFVVQHPSQRCFSRRRQEQS
jgi:hypothetical protein